MDDIAALLVSQEMSAACMVRDYVESHVDGPVVRALTHPRGRYGEWGWKFPDRDAPSAMRLYIGQAVTGVAVVENVRATFEFDAHQLLVPLDEASRQGPEAMHIQGVDEREGTHPSKLWIF